MCRDMIKNTKLKLEKKPTLFVKRVEQIVCKIELKHIFKIFKFSSIITN
jgi:hypothetical protein